MYHFIGVKDEWMLLVAQALLDLDYVVTGSDDITDSCVIEGINVFPFDVNNIKETDMYIVKSNSISDDNIELKQAENYNLKIYTYMDILNKLSNLFESIVVSGTCGKSTISSILSHVLSQVSTCNHLIEDRPSIADKNNKYFVIEADEGSSNFKNYQADYIVVSNIALKEIDEYSNIQQAIDAYQDLCNNANKMVLACGDDNYTRYLDLNIPVFFYGTDEDNDIKAIDIEYTEEGINFDVIVEDNFYGSFNLPIYGKHMLQNVLSVIAICSYERLEAREVAKALKSFKLDDNILNITNVDNNYLVNDKANHPNEIKATLRAIKQKFPKKETTIVFSNTVEYVTPLIKEYNSSLNQFDNVVILEEEVADLLTITANLRIGNFETNDYPESVILFINNDLSIKFKDNIKL